MFYGQSIFMLEGCKDLGNIWHRANHKNRVFRLLLAKYAILLCKVSGWLRGEWR